MGASSAMTGNRVTETSSRLESSFTPRLPLAPPPQASARPGAPSPRRAVDVAGGRRDAARWAAWRVPTLSRGEGVARGAGLGWEAQRVGGALMQILKEPPGRPGPAREHARPRRRRAQYRPRSAKPPFGLRLRPQYRRRSTIWAPPSHCAYCGHEGMGVVVGCACVRLRVWGR